MTIVLKNLSIINFYVFKSNSYQRKRLNLG